MDIQILEKLDRIEKTITSSHLEKWINIRGVSDYTSLSIPKWRTKGFQGSRKVIVQKRVG